LRIHHTVKGLTGLSLAESALRQRFGINLMALQRGEEILTDIGPQTVVEVDDLLYVLGKPDAISSLNKTLKDPKTLRE
jgi:CPA2 family monovalent cation:H+ antiporter-2